MPPRNRNANANVASVIQSTIEQMPVVKVVSLGCRWLNGSYPKLKTSHHPFGLKFNGGRVTILEEELEELKTNVDFLRVYRATGGEIYRIMAGRRAPESNAPAVLNSSSTTNDEIASRQIGVIEELNNEESDIIGSGDDSMEETPGMQENKPTE